jgi:dienelactone hydrolase
MEAFFDLTGAPPFFRPEMKLRLAILGVLSCAALLDHARASDRPQEVTISAGQYQLHGCFQTPEGPPPYPVMIFNHGSEKNPAPCGPPALADLYQRRGFAFFTFQRHGHGASPGEYIMDIQRRAYLTHPFDGSAAQREMISVQELYNRDVESAVRWVRGQEWADSHRIVMSGISFGGIQTLLTAEKGLGIRAFVAFAPAAQSWNPALGERLKQAVRGAHEPVFVIQAQNDYSLEPSRALGIELDKKGAPNQAKIYPSFGSTAQDGHWRFAASPQGSSYWAPDVFVFLQAAMR